MADTVILLFIKAPIRGRVKSRLARAVGDEAALDLYKNFVLDEIEMLRASGYPFRLCHYPPEAGSMIQEWVGREHASMPQHGKDLGERMEYAFSQAFSEGFTRAVLVGSDIPDLTSSLMRQAFRYLESAHAVLGPAADGGYYLIGFRSDSFLPAAFKGMDWSTDSVFKKTRDVLESAGLSVSLLPELCDLDTADDLEAFFLRNSRSGFRTSRTMTYLDRHKAVIFSHNKTIHVQNK